MAHLGQLLILLLPVATLLTDGASIHGQEALVDEDIHSNEEEIRPFDEFAFEDNEQHYDSYMYAQDVPVFKMEHEGEEKYVNEEEYDNEVEQANEQDEEKDEYQVNPVTSWEQMHEEQPSEKDSKEDKRKDLQTAQHKKNLIKHKTPGWVQHLPAQLQHPPGRIGATHPSTPQEKLPWTMQHLPAQLQVDPGKIHVSATHPSTPQKKLPWTVQHLPAQLQHAPGKTGATHKVQHPPALHGKKSPGRKHSLHQVENINEAHIRPPKSLGVKEGINQANLNEDYNYKNKKERRSHSMELKHGKMLGAGAHHKAKHSSSLNRKSGKMASNENASNKKGGSKKKKGGKKAD